MSVGPQLTVPCRRDGLNVSQSGKFPVRFQSTPRQFVPCCSQATRPKRFQVLYAFSEHKSQKKSIFSNDDSEHVLALNHVF